MFNKDTQHLHISTWTIVRFLGVIFLLWAIYLARDVVVALFFAVIIASAIEPGIEWLKARKVPRILSVIFIYVVLGLLLALAVYLIVPLLFDELRSVSTAFPKLQEQALEGLDQIGVPLIRPVEDVDTLFKVPTDFLQGVGGGIINFASAIFGGIFSFVLIIIFSFYIAAQERGIESFIKLITPLAHESYVVDVWERAQRKLGKWLRAQLFLGAMVGILIFFGLFFLGVEHAFLFGVIAALFEIIPVVGPILAAVPAVAVAFLQAPTIGIVTVGIYILVQQLESHVIVPVVMRKTIGLSPLIVVLALLVGAKLGGIIGILLSVPLTAIGAEFLNDWDKKKRALIPE